MLSVNFLFQHNDTQVVLIFFYLLPADCYLTKDSIAGFLIILFHKSKKGDSTV